jgi:hypothetical protein
LDIHILFWRFGVWISPALEFGFPSRPFGFLKHDQQYKEGYQRQDKKYRPAPVMDGGIDHPRPDVNTKFANGEDPEAVPQQSQGNRKQCE